MRSGGSQAMMEVCNREEEEWKSVEEQERTRVGELEMGHWKVTVLDQVCFCSGL